MFWQLPPQLFHDLVAHALGAFGVIWPHVYVDKGPGEFTRNFRAQPVHFVVMAFDADDVCAIDEGVEDFALLQVRGNENISLQSG